VSEALRSADAALALDHGAENFFCLPMFQTVRMLTGIACFVPDARIRRFPSFRRLRRSGLQRGQNDWIVAQLAGHVESTAALHGQAEPMK